MSDIHFSKDIKKDFNITDKDEQDLKQTLADPKKKRSAFELNI